MVLMSMGTKLKDEPMDVWGACVIICASWFDCGGTPFRWTVNPYPVANEVNDTKLITNTRIVIKVSRNRVWRRRRLRFDRANVETVLPRSTRLKIVDSR